LKDIIKKMVLGTAQFGMDYGIANVSGKPKKKEVFGILDLAWERGVRRFDTAPGYESEALLGDYINTNGLQGETILLTKLPFLGQTTDYKATIKKALELSLDKLGCRIEVLFFHDPVDSKLLLDDSLFFEKLLQDYPVSSLGVSVYEPKEVEMLSGCELELAFQFPLNVVDRRFENVAIPLGKRYARSVFLQGLLASPNRLRPNAPEELMKIKKEYHKFLDKHHLDPISFSLHFVMNSDCADYFVLGVDTEKQLNDILRLDTNININKSIMDRPISGIDKNWLDPREWN